MIRRLLVVVTFVALALGGTVAVLLAANAPPTGSAASTPGDPGKPFVVKLHARWCPYCLLQKDEWSQIETAYAGRVNFVVLDFTSERATARSRDEAARLGLSPFFENYAGATGLVVLLDGRTKEVLGEVGGSETFEEFRRAIDAALARRLPSAPPA